MLLWDCEIRQTAFVDKDVAKAYKRSTEMDSFIKYKDTNKPPLPEEVMAQFEYTDNIWIPFHFVSESGKPLFMTSQYFDVKKYISKYADEPDFMWSFKILYWDDKIAFEQFQDSVRSDIKKFFKIIEKSDSAETQMKYFKRMMKSIVNENYNDAQFLLMLFPDMREVLSDKALMQNYFHLDMASPKTWSIIRWTIAKKAGINVWLPWTSLWLNPLWRAESFKDDVYSKTLYSKLPDCIKTEYFRVPVWVDVSDLKIRKEFIKEENPLWVRKDWSLFITADTFKKLTDESQVKLYNRLFDEYKVSIEWWSDRLREEMASHIKSNVMLRWAETICIWLKKILKTITSSSFYALWLLLWWSLKWVMSLISLNSWMHLPRWLAIGRKNWFNWIMPKASFLWWTDNQRVWFMKKYWIFSWGERKRYDAPFNWEWSMQWIWWVARFIESNVNRFMESQWFNVSDWLLSSWYRKSNISDYINIHYPWIDSIDEFDRYLSNLSEEARKAEINKLVKYVDDRMHIRYNNSVDQYRFVNYWIDVWDWWWATPYITEVANLFSNMWWFYRNYMKSASNNYWNTIKYQWNSNTWKQVREMMEKYINGTESWDNIRNLINDRYAKNQDFQELLDTFLYSYALTRSIYKADYHNNWQEDDYDWSTIIKELYDLFELFAFPIEAWQWTDIWMAFMAASEAMHYDMDALDNTSAVMQWEYKMTVKQLTKPLWFAKSITQLVSSLTNNEEEWGSLSWTERLQKISDIMLWVIWWFWYYVKDEMARTWYDQYIPKTQNALVKEIFGNREVAIQWYDELNKASNAIKANPFRDWDAFSNWMLWNTPFIQHWKSWEIWDWQDQFVGAFDEMKQTEWYKEFINWNLPYDYMDDTDRKFLYNISTKHTVKWLEKISDDFLSDLSYNLEDWTLVTWFNEDVKEKIWHKLMLENVDKSLFDAAVDLLTTAEKDYEANALQALLYMDAQSPWAWQKLLSYIMSSEATQQVFYSWRFWKWHKDEFWNYTLFEKNNRWWYTPAGKAAMSEAYNIVWQEMAKKYFQYTYITDKELWLQWLMKVAKHQWWQISEWITDSNSAYNNTLWIKQSLFDSAKKIKDDWSIDFIKSTDLKEVFTMQTYVDIAAAEWEPDPYKMYNIFTKLLSESWNKDKNWILTESASRAMLYKYNYLMEHIDDLWVTELEKNTMLSAILLQSDQFINKLINSRSKEENLKDQNLQTALHFLWWTADSLNTIADRYVKEIVQKEYTWVDPSTVQLSRVTSTTKKGWYSNWKQYYMKNTYFYDSLRSMAKNYSKYRNNLYSYKKQNATSPYSKKEWEARWFSTVIASIWKWWGWSSWTSRSEWATQDEASGYTTQRRWSARPFVNWWDLEKIPERRYKPMNRRTASRKIWNSVWNKLNPSRRRRIKQIKSDTPTMT